MPRIASLARTWILERLVLEPFGGESDLASILQQQIPVGRDQVRHGSAVPDVPVQPQPTGHGVNHPLAAGAILAEDRRTGVDILVARRVQERRLCLTL